MISGFSGLPKFRQLVRASGRAPVQATLRAASATAAIVPPARDRASRSAGCSRRRAPAPCASACRPRASRARARRRRPGRRMVLPCTSWSYWRQIHAFEPKFGSSSSASSAAPGSSSGATLARSSFWRSRRSAGSRAGRSSSGRARRHRVAPGCRPPSRPRKRTRMRPSPVTRPTTTASRPQRRNTSQTALLAPGARHQQHALLALREQQLVGRQVRRAARHAVEVHLDAGAAAARHLEGRAGEARRRPCPGCRPRRRRASARGRPRSGTSR